MPQGGANSFFRFVLGFTVFIAVSFGLTYAVATFSVERDREEQVSAAFRAMIGEDTARAWWDII